MLAAYAARGCEHDPLSALEVGDVAEPEAPDGWTKVRIRAAALNQHDLRSLRGLGLPAERLPIVLGSDGAGITEAGEEVVVHSLVGDPGRGGGDETMDPERSLLSEMYPGTFAEVVSVPARNVVRKPPELSWEHAGSVSTAWLTSFRILFVRGGLQPGETVLVQGAGGGVATAAVTLGRAAGARMWVTSRSEAKRTRAVALGADAAFESGARLPERVDVVVETVGDATFDHSLRSVRPGGRVVVAGAHSGGATTLDLRRLYIQQVDVRGSTMGTREDLERLLAFMVDTGIRPEIDSTYPLGEARSALSRLLHGDVFGKIVLLP